MQLRTAGTWVDLSRLQPHAFAGQSIAQIERWKLDARHCVGDLFRVTGEADDTLRLVGDFRNGHFIGAKMHGGVLHVDGSAGHYVGAQMTGGILWIHGDVGSHAASAYYGSRIGMNGGTLVVDGNAGSRLGFRMRRGLAIVKGDTGPQAGTQMQAGTIGVFGHSSPPIGAEMRRGTILLANGSPDQLAPTFRFACRARPVAFVLLQKHIRQFGVAIRADEQPSLYNGDFLTGGRGEVWMADST